MPDSPIRIDPWQLCATGTLLEPRLSVSTAARPRSYRWVAGSLTRHKRAQRALKSPASNPRAGHSANRGDSRRSRRTHSPRSYRTLSNSGSGNRRGQSGLLRQRRLQVTGRCVFPYTLLWGGAVTEGFVDAGAAARDSMSIDAGDHPQATPESAQEVGDEGCQEGGSQATTDLLQQEAVHDPSGFETPPLNKTSALPQTPNSNGEGAFVQQGTSSSPSLHDPPGSPAVAAGGMQQTVLYLVS